MRSVLAVLTVASLAASALAVSGCGATESTPPAAGGSAGKAAGASGGGRNGGGGGAAPVSIATVEERAVPVTLRAVGTVQAPSTVDIRSQVTGQLLSIGFSEGQDVKEGQTLFTLDPRPFQTALAQAQAVLQRDTVQANNLEVQLKRADDLLARGIMTKADHDTASANYAAIKATVAADAAAVDTAKLNLQFTTITAPVSGRTGQLLVHTGALIRANDTTAMVTISQTSPIQVSFAVPARMLPKMRADMQKAPLRMTASVPGTPEGTSTGTLGFIDSSADTGTDTIKVKGTFPNGNHQLWPGQYVDVTLQLAVEPRAIVIPTAAVQTGQKGTYVYVIGNGDVAKLQPVTVSFSDGAMTVVETGVAAGDRVVTDGQLRLTDGAKVSIKPGVPTAPQL